MRYIIIILLLLSNFCYSQNLQYDDSVSRARADIVLSHFDSVKVSKLLYSIDNTYYLVLLNDTPFLREYFFKMDSSGNIIYTKFVQQKKQVRKNRITLNELIKNLSPFDLNKYDTSYITSVPADSYFFFGRMNYFVIKDTNQKRYGEYHLFMPVKHHSIDLNLWAYLIRRLSEKDFNKFRRQFKDIK
jgi:hypothetical protein